ncbi:sugar diacid recognition domain-containing protein [Streptomyces sp. WMMB 322]|uniref:CdaR family transcriptional regulator n=1 Tax=Streptomyces sp. WMMB 322 TaxID=1286821 RepID=UPI0006E2A776|nr:sugar diacid recognition domain-containing protein [Streptomyces sp. WMMB 322]SCK57516.1 carbohydrate diacid regulator [Streptomyces sp. WMMB 322]
MADAGRAPVLTPELAQEIAGETSAIIGLNVLITDREGTVIGSGDTLRVGTVHEASRSVLETLSPRTHTAEEVRKLHGVRPGITLPIVLDGVPVGTVGLTGAPRRVRQFGRVVQRQTEILLQESVLQRYRMVRERAREDLLRDVAFFDPDSADPAVIVARAAELGVDLLVRRAAVLVVTSHQDAADARPGPSGRLPSTASPLRTVRGVFNASHDVVAEMRAGRIAVLCHVSTGADWAYGLEDRCHSLVDELQRRHGIAAHVGFGEAGADVAALHASYTDADDAVRIGPKVISGEAVFPVRALRIEQLLTSAGHRARARFSRDQLAGMADQPAGSPLRSTLVAWHESGFNLVHAARRLHIHRNTLLYRLDKISTLTGRNVRDPAEATPLYLACLVERLDKL